MRLLLILVLILAPAQTGAQDFDITPSKSYSDFSITPSESYAKPQQAKPQQAKPQQAKPQQAKPQQAKPQDEHYVYFFTSSNCPPCEKWLQVEAPKLRRMNYTVGDKGRQHVVIIDVDKYKAAADFYKITATPTFVAIRNKRALSRLEGYVTATSVIDMYDHIGPELEAALDQAMRAKPPETKPSAAQYHTPLNWNSWTWPGNLDHHLRTTHGVDTRGMSHQDMVHKHNTLHNSGR